MRNLFQEFENILRISFYDRPAISRETILENANDSFYKSNCNLYEYSLWIL